MEKTYEIFCQQSCVCGSIEEVQNDQKKGDVQSVKEPSSEAVSAEECSFPSSTSSSSSPLVAVDGERNENQIGVSDLSTQSHPTTVVTSPPSVQSPHSVPQHTASTQQAAPITVITYATYNTGHRRGSLSVPMSLPLSLSVSEEIVAPVSYPLPLPLQIRVGHTLPPRHPNTISASLLIAPPEPHTAPPPFSPPPPYSPLPPPTMSIILPPIPISPPPLYSPPPPYSPLCSTLPSDSASAESVRTEPVHTESVRTEAVHTEPLDAESRSFEELCTTMILEHSANIAEHSAVLAEEDAAKVESTEVKTSGKTSEKKAEEMKIDGGKECDDQSTDIIKISLKGVFTTYGRFKTRVEGALLSNINYRKQEENRRRNGKINKIIKNSEINENYSVSTEKGVDRNDMKNEIQIDGKQNVSEKIEAKGTDAGTEGEGKGEGDMDISISISGCGIYLPSDVQYRVTKWNKDADYSLLEYLNSHPSTSTSSSIFSSPELIVLSKQFLTFRAGALSYMNLLDIQIRVLLFESINKNFIDLLPLVNVLCTDTQSIGSMMRKYSRYVFLSSKQALLDRVVSATVTASGADLPAQLSLDNVKSLNSREKNPAPGDVNCFVQAYRQLENRDNSVYRHVFSTDRVFQITFVGENGIDAGGVFREGTSRIVEDLFSEYSDLLILCPNGRHEVHSNMDKYVPNPVLTDPLSLKMFEFIGKLMGMSLRVQSCLPFEFVPLVWKKIIGEDIIFDDLFTMDAISCRLLNDLKSCTQHGINDEISFSEKYGMKLKFLYVGSDGIEREVEPGSKDRIVRFSNRLEYCKLVENARYHEFDLQILAIGKGIAQVAPMRVLKLFSWQQLETLISGSPEFDFELWKSKTESTGLSSKTVDLFWKVMATLTSKEQSGFIRFAWGRSRLPSQGKFSTKMKLSFGQGKLPVAHTCFFSIELPEYATEEEMRAGLLTAINFGVGGILMG